jgi:hypothetical protein
MKRNLNKGSVPSSTRRDCPDGDIFTAPDDDDGTSARAANKQHFCAKLYVQVIFAIIAGALVGYLYPKFGASLKPLGDVFIKGIKMVVAPIIFTTVVCGIAKMGNLRRVANIGVKSIVYFEVVSTLALLLGWFAADMIRPGDGINANPASFSRATWRPRTRWESWTFSCPLFQAAWSTHLRKGKCCRCCSSRYCLASD